jgi:hypothetical protein
MVIDDSRPAGGCVAAGASRALASLRSPLVDARRAPGDRPNEEGAVRTIRGFCLAELLVASAIALILTLGLLSLADPGMATSKAQAAGIDIQQRLRAASEALEADVLAAGSGPLNGAFGRALGLVAPSVLPFRVGARGDPVASFRADALTLLFSPRPAVAASLRVPWVPSAGPAEVVAGPGCPAGDATCGLRADDVVMVLDGRGQADLFRIESAAGGLVTLAARGPTSGRAFPAGSALIPVTVVSYYLKAGLPADGGQLMSADGDQVDLPMVDHVTALSFQLLAEPRPPVLRTATPPQATYGPSPPAVDEVASAWPAGESCIFTLQGSTHVSRLAPLGAGSGLVPLTASNLTDGPWCPDQASAWRYDADLLRVRGVRVTIRVEAATAAVRGASPSLFAHPGLSRERAATAADQEVTFDVVPRSLQSGR